MGGCRAEGAGTAVVLSLSLPRCCGSPLCGGGWCEEPPELGEPCVFESLPAAHGSPLTLFTSHCRVWLGNKQEKMGPTFWFRTKLVFLRFALRLSGIFIVCLILTVLSESSHP